MKTSEKVMVSTGIIAFFTMMSIMAIGVLPNAEPTPAVQPPQTKAKIHCTTYPAYVQCESPPYYPE